MLTLSASISYDSKGNILHKGDRVLAPIQVSGMFGDNTVGVEKSGDEIEAEIYDVLIGNRIVVTHPEDKTLIVLDAGNATKCDKVVDVVQHFEGDQIGRMNEDSEMGRARLMTPKDELLNEVADALLALMKDVRKVVMPLQYNIKKIESVITARTGRVMEGRVEAEVYVSDLSMKRKSHIYVELVVKDGDVQKPFMFTASDGKQFLLNEAGMKKFLNIPATPYFGKRPPEATLSFRKD